MKILVTTTTGLGHNLPMLPLAVELKDRGHEVHWITGQSSAETVVGSGIELTVAGMPFAERLAEFDRRHPDAGTLPVPERRELAFSVIFGELAAPSTVEVVCELADSWHPDLVLHGAAELSGPLAASRLGVPSVCLGFGDVVPEPSVRRAAEKVAPLWAAAGLTPDPHAGSYRGLYIDIYPPSLSLDDRSYIPRVQLRRPASGPRASGSLVYVTFGTVFNAIDDGFRTAIVGAAAVADEVLVTVGPNGDPSAMGEVPENVRVERFVPQADVLPRCAAVVCHGGSGTLLASLAHGVPLLCLPRGADQFSNGANVARVGAGAMLTGDEVTEATVRTAMVSLLESTSMRDAANVLAQEIAAMPSDAEVATAIESFAGAG